MLTQCILPSTDFVYRYICFLILIPAYPDCGGTLTAPDGDIASPNWPQHYSHRERCIWNIQTSPYKIIKLSFSHLELAMPSSSDPCDPDEDRLILREEGKEPSCIQRNTRFLPSHGNRVTLEFTTNSHVDAQGFRLFYTTGGILSVLFFMDIWCTHIIYNVHVLDHNLGTRPKFYSYGARC